MADLLRIHRSRIATETAEGDEAIAGRIEPSALLISDGGVACHVFRKVRLPLRRIVRDNARVPDGLRTE
jgi:hypothetical protein